MPHPPTPRHIPRHTPRHIPHHTPATSAAGLTRKMRSTAPLPSRPAAYPPLASSSVPPSCRLLRLSPPRSRPVGLCQAAALQMKATLTKCCGGAFLCLAPMLGA